MKKEKMQIIFLLFILGGGVIYAYYNYLFKPEWTIIQDQKQQVSERTEFRKKLLGYSANLEKLKKEINSLESQSIELSVKIPSSLEKPQIMYDIYSLAKKNGVSPKSITFGDVENKESLQTLTIKFSCAGDPAKILSLIKDIEKEKAERLTIQTANLRVEETGVNADIELLAFASKIGNKEETNNKPTFMDSGFGVDESFKLFQP